MKSKIKPLIELGAEFERFNAPVVKPKPTFPFNADGSTSRLKWSMFEKDGRFHIFDEQFKLIVYGSDLRQCILKALYVARLRKVAAKIVHLKRLPPAGIILPDEPKIKAAKLVTELPRGEKCYG